MLRENKFLKQYIYMFALILSLYKLQASYYDVFYLLCLIKIFLNAQITAISHEIIYHTIHKRFGRVNIFK